MLNKIKLVLSNKTLVRRIAITLLILLVFKIGTAIAIPLVDTIQLKAAFTQSDFLTILNTFSGGALGQFSILALGISPYITASIVIQLLQMVVPKFKEWADQGEVGKQKMNRLTRYAAVVLAFAQALALVFGLEQGVGNIFNNYVAEHRDLYPLFYIYMALVITAGSCFVIWLADLITRYGVGNGSSMIIATGILTSIPSMFTLLQSKYLVNINAGNITKYSLIIFLYVAIIIGVIYLESVQRKIPVQYANRQGKSDSNIPIKLNTSGVIPVIFASTILSLPSTILGLLGISSDDSTLAFWINQVFSYREVVGMMLYILLIFVFAFFYAFMTVDPDKISDNLQKSNAFIPTIRQGEETKNYVSRVLFKVTLIGATYLTVLALIPIIMAKVFAFSNNEASTITIGGTSLLIIVGVAIETMKQLETDATDQTYSGLIE